MEKYQKFVISVYRQGDKGTSWYAVLVGTLDVHVSKTGIVEVRCSSSTLFVENILFPVRCRAKYNMLRVHIARERGAQMDLPHAHS